MVEYANITYDLLFVSEAPRALFRLRIAFSFLSSLHILYQIQAEKQRVLEAISLKLATGDAAREQKEQEILNKAIKEQRLKSVTRESYCHRLQLFQLTVADCLN